jgi:hypothetical protein
VVAAKIAAALADPDWMTFRYGISVPWSSIHLRKHARRRRPSRRRADAQDGTVVTIKKFEFGLVLPKCLWRCIFFVLL